MRFLIGGILIIIGVVAIVKKVVEIGREDGPPVFTIRGRSALWIGIAATIIGIAVILWG